MAREANFDGLVGPTHNYSGLSIGNVASQDNLGQVSNPREAAQQGLAKMWILANLGIPQGVFPPHERPFLPGLRDRGFTGSDARVLAQAAATDPDALRQVSSASAMWAANAATVSPSADTADRRVHITPANLSHSPHRAIEAAITGRVLAATFPDDTHFAHHPPLAPELRDEGAANHTRLAVAPGQSGVELFVYGSGGHTRPNRYPGRQTLGASRAIVDSHTVRASVLAQQHPKAIDAGVFHNDVIAVGHLTTLLVHERAFVDQQAVLAALDDLLGGELAIIEVSESSVSLEASVGSYLFNSQLVTVDGDTVLVAPSETADYPDVKSFLDELVRGPAPIDRLLSLDLRQSMRNGGGPACLRLRIVLTEEERAATNPATWLTAALHTQLGDWIDRHYRDSLAPGDLADPELLLEGRAALDELTQILQLGNIYDFQR